MADKLSHLLTAALAKAAADPAGAPLVGTRADPGLFPPTAAAKPAATKAVADGLLRVVRTEANGKQPRDLYAATDAGLRYLLDQTSPRQVLDDLVRALEQREGQVADLAAAAHRMADTLAGLKAAVAAVLPRVAGNRPTGHEAPHMNGAAALEAPPGGGRVGPDSRSESATRADPADGLAEAVLLRLADWAAAAGAGQDCPLPELYRSLTPLDPPPTIGGFHDCLRRLHADGRVYLHPWTGPLYALPDPAYALLAGHNVAYYASAR